MRKGVYGPNEDEWAKVRTNHKLTANDLELVVEERLEEEEVEVRFEEEEAEAEG